MAMVTAVQVMARVRDKAKRRVTFRVRARVSKPTRQLVNIRYRWRWGIGVEARLDYHCRNKMYHISRR